MIESEVMKKIMMKAIEDTIYFRVDFTGNLKLIFSWVLIHKYTKTGISNITLTKAHNVTTSSSINPVKTFVNYIQSDVPTLADHQASIPEKINHILQEQIKGTALAEKAIRVSDWQKGVAFLVEGNIFHEIHDIPMFDRQNTALRGGPHEVWQVVGDPVLRVVVPIRQRVRHVHV